ncbi:hypothetical protein [Flammeovirga sp. SubArs3]|uniref:hypothetical protein n=1 Tax=Flammeovirga sp. SubArs3 TaxID=2995316 RepID=UPI00248D3A04|nr:hypothetical protein [Flammeovirga sp. SubArs3]
MTIEGENQEFPMEELSEEQSSHEEVTDKPKKSNWKYIVLGILILLIGTFLWWTRSLPTTPMWVTLPSSPGILIGSENVLSSWKEIRDSEWDESISEALTPGKRKVYQSAVGENSFLHLLMSDYPAICGMYQTEKEGKAIIGVVNLGWKAKLTHNLRFILGKKFILESQVFGDQVLVTSLKRNNHTYGYYFVYNNLLVFTTHQSLAKRSIESIEEGGELTDLSGKSFTEGALFEVWAHPSAVYSLMESYFVEPLVSIKGLGKLLGYQHWVWNKEEKQLKASITTQQKGFSLESVWWMWSGTQSSKELLTVIPKDVTMASQWGLSNKINERRAALKRAGVAPWEVIEQRLKINIAKDFDSWLGDEAAWVKLLPSQLKGKDGEVMLLKTDNPALASEKLRDLNELIEKQTLERFSELKYRGFAIGYLGIEDLLPRIYGEAFDRIKRPYYTVLGNAVAFSNHPLSLKRLIDAKLDNKTIDIDSRTIPKSAMYFWGQGEALYQDLPLWIDQEGLKLMRNKKTLMGSIVNFEGVLSPRSKFNGASFVTFQYGDEKEAQITLEQLKREQTALDEKKISAYLDEKEMPQQKAFMIAAPKVADDNNMIKFK